VGDEDRRRAGRAQHLAYLLAEFGAELGVDVAEGLVEQDERGRRGERPCERHALLLAARQLVWVPRAEASQVDELEHLARADAAAGRREVGEAEGDVILERAMREERVVLKPDAAPSRLGRHELAAAGLRHGPPADEDLSLVRRLEARDEAERRRLATAGWTNEPEDLAARGGERKALDRGLGAAGEALGDGIAD